MVSYWTTVSLTLEHRYFPTTNFSFIPSLPPGTVKPHFTDTCLIQTPHYYGQFAFSLGTESSYIFSEFNLVNPNTVSKRTLSMAPSVSVLIGFDCS